LPVKNQKEKQNEKDAKTEPDFHVFSHSHFRSVFVPGAGLEPAQPLLATGF
jgi:hypothetical protein